MHVILKRKIYHEIIEETDVFVLCNIKIELLVCSSFEIEYAIHNEPGTDESIIDYFMLWTEKKSNQILFLPRFGCSSIDCFI